MSKNTQILRGLLISFTIIQHRKPIKKHRKTSHRHKLRFNIFKSAAFQNYHPNDLNKISGGIEFGGDLRPFRHRINICIKSTQQNEYHHKEKCNKHGLLLGIDEGRKQQRCRQRQCQRPGAASGRAGPKAAGEMRKAPGNTPIEVETATLRWGWGWFTHAGSSTIGLSEVPKGG